MEMTNSPRFFASHTFQIPIFILYIFKSLSTNSRLPRIRIVLVVFYMIQTIPSLRKNAREFRRLSVRDQSTPSGFVSCRSLWVDRWCDEIWWCIALCIYQQHRPERCELEQRQSRPEMIVKNTVAKVIQICLSKPFTRASFSFQVFPW